MSYYPPYPGRPMPGQYPVAPQPAYWPVYPDESGRYHAVIHPRRGRSATWDSMDLNLNMAIPPAVHHQQEERMKREQERKEQDEKNQREQEQRQEEEKKQREEKERKKRSAMLHDRAHSELKKIEEDALNAEPSEEDTSDRLFKLDGSELRQIVLSTCVPSVEMTRRVIKNIERREGKNVTVKEESLGFWLQKYDQGEIVCLITYIILKNDKNGSAERAVLQLLDSFESRKKLNLLLS
ncbi:hypothetical protein F4805DRAFT_393783 [Annulohypoxylon moriforme]|nr:hypothetical protein F4805DRAFT_393783 [Annulohypoxylon moriforme]